MSKSKFYVVWEGQQTGVFTDWSEVQPLVAGYPGAKHKSYATMKEAQEAYKLGPAISKTKAPSSLPTASTRKSLKKTLSQFVFDEAYSAHIFSDGACDPNPGEAGSGVAVYENKQLSQLWYGCYETRGTNNSAELNALHHAMLIAKGMCLADHKILILSDSFYSINAMIKWAAGWKKNGWARKGNEVLANKELIIEMHDLYQRLSGNVDLVHVKGHSGVEGNELADRLSLLAHREKIAEFEMLDGIDRKEELLNMK